MKLADWMVADFDFNAWKQFASEHPEDFEQCRQELINQLIASASDRQQLMLKRLQFRIDGERIRSRTPLKACLRISSLMWDSLLELRTGLNDFVATAQADSQNNKRPVSTSHSATIMPLIRRQ